MTRRESLVRRDCSWMEDNTTERCCNERCAARFSLFIKHKHHCRFCGKIYCDKCAPLLPVANGTPLLKTNFSEARKCNACRYPECLVARRHTNDSKLNAQPAEIILLFLDDKSISQLLQTCVTSMSEFHVRGVPYYQTLQDRFPTLFSGAQVGKGACGTVYKVEDHLKLSGEKVAVKVVEKRSIHSYHSWKKLLCEIDIMRGNQHPNVACLLEVFQTKRQLCIVMELGEGGSLKRAYEVVKKKQYDIEVFTANVVGQVAQGLEYLYFRRQIVHRDIKHDNIVLSADFSRVMIIDFGLAEIVKHVDTQKFVPCGTLGFASPENIQAVVDRRTWFDASGFMLHESDLFSLGVVAFMLLSGTKPFKSNRFGDMHHEVRKGIRCAGQRWLNVSDDAKHLVEWMLMGPTRSRATAENIVQHRFVTNSISRFSLIERDRTLEIEDFNRVEEEEWVFVRNQFLISQEWKVIDSMDFKESKLLNSIAEDSGGDADVAVVGKHSNNTSMVKS